jgi:hypothetical protein
MTGAAKGGRDERPAVWGRTPSVAGGPVACFPHEVDTDEVASSPTTSINVSKQQLYRFFRELARPFDPHGPPAPPSPNEMQQPFSAAEKYEYWLASPDENAAIGISLRWD